MVDNELSELGQLCTDYVGAHAERTRIFSLLGASDLSDHDRKILIGEYAAAARKFDDMRAKLLKS